MLNLNYNAAQKHFAERSKILLDINLEIILLGYQNNYIRNSKMMSNAANNFDILAISLSFEQNYFDDSTKFPIKF